MVTLILYHITQPAATIYKFSIINLFSKARSLIYPIITIGSDNNHLNINNDNNLIS